MQDALLTLTKYWTDRGCMMVQPFNTEVGAGTLNPATVLRVLGPEPWRVAYVEPSVRPDDARYGENPNRLQTHTQFQVILKPDPGNPQELFLGSLEALGIDIRAHDIRFVEDNWASPALGAWGLGWEVWLDGLEITQFTYFQQAGGMPLDPVSVEITYGVERIMMALQNVGHFKDIAYAPGISYGEAFGQSEYEMSRYYLDDADVEANKRLFEEYANEARRMLDARLPVPAHYCVLKCSHTFNVLDSRGAVSTTERAKAFGRMRGLSREVAKLWQERREELGYPLGVYEPLALATAAEVKSEETEQTSTLLFEIGLEELPSAEIRRTAESVREALITKLAATRLTHGEVRTYGTPRRIVALIDDVAPQEPDAERVVRGPRVNAAFDGDGSPSKAGLGFARGQGVEFSALKNLDVDGVTHVSVTKPDPGRTALEVLSGLLAGVVSELRAEKNMRWSDPTLSFSRPIRWLVALLDEVQIPVTVSALQAGRTTRVHRLSATPEIEIATARGYRDLLAAHDIVLDSAERRNDIVAAAQSLTAAIGGSVDVVAESALLDEIANLVERPTPILGSFDPKYLELPAEILTTVMRKHQRYLPVRDAQGALLPNFVAVANGSCDHDVVRAGNEAVLRARYEDAAFFWRADLQVAPEVMKEGLHKLAFEERLGSVADRAERISGIALALGSSVENPHPPVSLSTEDTKTLTRAAELAKFDLSSQMVIELTSLAGTMAREYAQRSGESVAVAEALYEMELPRTTGDSPPQTLPGALLALADRLDLLVGLFAVGANPTGSSDPFGLRRAALGVVTILRAHPELGGVTVSDAMSLAAESLRQQGIEVTEEVVTNALKFTLRRYQQQLHDAGHEHHFVEAVQPLVGTPSRAERTLIELTNLAQDPRFLELVAALQRVRRIVPQEVSAGYDSSVLVEPAEVALAEAVRKTQFALGSTNTLTEFADLAGQLVVPVNIFFDEILVMAEDPAVKAARLGLLATIREFSTGILDWPALGATQ